VTGSESSRLARPYVRFPSSAQSRLLRIAAVFHLADISGPAQSLRPRLAALAERGTLEVLTPGNGSLAEAYADVGAVHRLPYERLTVPRSLRELARALRRLGREVRLFRRELRRAAPDLVVIVTALLPAALVAARLERLPTVLYVGEIFAKDDLRGPLRTLGDRAIVRLSETLADRLVCCSETVRAQFSKPSKTVTIHPGISLEYAHGDGDRFRARHRLEAARPLIATVGNVTEGRGQDTAVRALARVRERLADAQLVVVGLPHPGSVDEAFANEVRDLACRLGLDREVVFSGLVEQVADVYAAADVVINPARFSEAFGRVAFEALVAGRPVVASAVGAIPEILRDELDALLVPRDDADALARAVVRLVEQRDLRERLVAEGGRRVREEFGEGVGVAAFTRVVDEVLGERKRGRGFVPASREA